MKQQRLQALLILPILLIPVFMPSKIARAATYDYQYIGQSGYPITKDGDLEQGWLQIKNTGTQAWQSTGANAMKLGTSHPTDRESGFSGTPLQWQQRNRIALSKNVSTGATGDFFTVQPGQTAEFDFNWTPFLHIYGTYREYFQPVVEGITWLPDIGIYWDVTVPAPTGVFMFNWYGDPADPNQRWYPIKDTPQFGSVNGHYSSADQTVMRQQLNLIRDAGFEFVVLDWWQNYTFENQNATTIAQIITAEYPTLKFTFLQEPPDGVTADTPIDQSTYDYFYNTYNATPSFFRVSGKLWLPTFYYQVTGNDNRFITQTFSNGRVYPDYWNNPVTSKNRISSVMSRYDDRQLCNAGLRTICQYNDATYSEGLINVQINQAVSFRPQTDVLMVTAWNEYYERTNIEPHLNPDSSVAPDYAYQIIKNFIYRWNNY